MNVQEKILARRYAHAFLNVYADSLSLDDYYHIKNAYEFLSKHKEITTHFRLPDVEEAKKKVVKKLFDAFQVPVSLFSLVDLILVDQRIFLLKDILRYLVKGYCQQKGYMEFSFQTSHALAENQRVALENFLEKKTKKTILYNEVVNKNLIVGIRLLSDSLLWEHSVAQQLRKAEHILRSKERL